MILLVKDHAAIRRAFATLLRRSRYDVIEAADGAEALRLIDK
jgi:CheY-like chemotaxis protein